MTEQPATDPSQGRPAVPAGPGGWRVSDLERDAVCERLGDAYAQGRLTREEFDARLQSALTAPDRARLGATLRGVSAPPPGPGWVPGPTVVRGRAAAPHPVARQVRAGGEERCWAAAAHGLGLLTSVLGPAVVLLGPGRRSPYVRDQAAEALNIQITFIVLNLALVAATVVTLGVAALLWVPVVLGWPFVVLLAALAALAGNPLRLPFVWRPVR